MRKSLSAFIFIVVLLFGNSVALAQKAKLSASSKDKRITVTLVRWPYT